MSDDDDGFIIKLFMVSNLFIILQLLNKKNVI